LLVVSVGVDIVLTEIVSFSPKIVLLTLVLQIIQQNRTIHRKLETLTILKLFSSNTGLFWFVFQGRNWKSTKLWFNQLCTLLLKNMMAQWRLSATISYGWTLQLLTGCLQNNWVSTLKTVIRSTLHLSNRQILGSVFFNI